MVCPCGRDSWCFLWCPIDSSFYVVRFCLNMKKKHKNPILFYLLVTFLIVNVLDFITSLFILPAETNPIVLLTQSPTIFFFFKVVIVGFAFLIYNKNEYPSHTTYYGFMLCLILGIFMLGLGTYSNIIGIMSPHYVSEVAQMPVKEKTQSYFLFVFIIYIAPILFSLLTFKLYRKSYRHIKLKKKINLLKQWNLK